MIPVLFILVGSLVGGFFLPWWVIAPVAFVGCFWQSRTAGSGFLHGALGVLLAWGGYALFLNGQNNGIMAARMGELLFKVPQLPALMLGLTPLLGGLIGGLAGLAGYAMRQVLLPWRNHR